MVLDEYRKASKALNTGEYQKCITRLYTRNAAKGKLKGIGEPPRGMFTGSTVLG